MEHVYTAREYEHTKNGDLTCRQQDHLYLIMHICKIERRVLVLSDFYNAMLQGCPVCVC